MIDQVAGIRGGAGSLSRDAAELTGRARTHVVDIAEPACALHKHALAPFLPHAPGRTARRHRSCRSRAASATSTASLRSGTRNGTAFARCTMSPGSPWPRTSLAPPAARRGHIALVGAARREPPPLGHRRRSDRWRAGGRRPSVALDRPANTPAADHSSRWPRGSTGMRHASASFGRSAACSPACKPSPGILASRPSPRARVAR